MELKTLLNMYTNASSAYMCLKLKNGETVRTSLQSFTHYNSDLEEIECIQANARGAVYPWIVMLEKFGTVEISDFSTQDDTIIFWERGIF